MEKCFYIKNEDLNYLQKVQSIIEKFNISSDIENDNKEYVLYILENWLNNVNLTLNNVIDILKENNINENFQEGGIDFSFERI